MAVFINTISNAISSLFGDRPVAAEKAKEKLSSDTYVLWQFFRFIGTVDVAAKNFWSQLDKESPEEAAEKIRDWMRENRTQLDWSVHQKVLLEELASFEGKVNQLIRDQVKLKIEEGQSPSYLEMLFEIMMLANCPIPKEALLFDLTDSELSRLFLFTTLGNVFVDYRELLQAMLSDPAISGRIREDDFSEGFVNVARCFRSSQKIELLFSSERFQAFSPAVQARLSARALGHAILAGYSSQGEEKIEKIRTILQLGKFQEEFAQKVRKALEPNLNEVLLNILAEEALKQAEPAASEQEKQS